MIVKKEREIGGKILSIETGRLAKQANGAALVTYGDTMILAVATASKEPREGIDFFPLSVEYQEKSYAAGKIPGGFFKREGRPGAGEILSARLIDRPIRPLFPDHFKNETQVVIFVISSDRENSADVLGGVGASAALTISDIPFQGPIASVRVGRIDGQMIINPTITQQEESDINLIVSGTDDSIMMVEGESDEISEAEMLEALKFGHDAIRDLVALQNELAAELNIVKMEVVAPEVPADIESRVTAFCEGKIAEAI
nr:polyribonucleotide nucleotidyltransferase [Calditrichia bacterium]